MGVSLAGAGRRRGRRGLRKGRQAEINVTPFVDVMLVLLIVFMVTAPLLTVGVAVELPKTEAKQLPPETEPLSISIQRNGDIYLQETKVSFEDLLPQMQAIAAEGYERRIFIRADAGVAYGRVAEVMAALNTAGYRNLGMVTDPMAARGGRGAPAE